VAAVSGRNMRRALLTLEVARVQQYPLTDSQEVSPPDWELYIRVGGVPAKTWRRL
jgi:replication factor C subunit 3/5